MAVNRPEWLKMSVSEAIDALCAERGLQEAHRLALREQRLARQARSRKRFAFWTAVVAETGGVSTDRAEADLNDTPSNPSKRANTSKAERAAKKGVAHNE